MSEQRIVMTVPATKDGFQTLKYLSKQLVENDIFVKLVSKKEFDVILKGHKGESK